MGWDGQTCLCMKLNATEGVRTIDSERYNGGFAFSEQYLPDHMVACRDLQQPPIIALITTPLLLRRIHTLDGPAYKLAAPDIHHPLSFVLPAGRPADAGARGSGHGEWRMDSVIRSAGHPIHWDSFKQSLVMRTSPYNMRGHKADSCWWCLQVKALTEKLLEDV
ncbi:hypothetical protein CBL_07274 [Carabus blaptoides fortunei]